MMQSQERLNPRNTWRNVVAICPTLESIIRMRKAKVQPMGVPGSGGTPWGWEDGSKEHLTQFNIPNSKTQKLAPTPESKFTNSLS